MATFFPIESQHIISFWNLQYCSNFIISETLNERHTLLSHTAPHVIVKKEHHNTSHHTLPYHTTPQHTISWEGTPQYITSHFNMSYHTPAHHILRRNTVTHHITSHYIMSYRTTAHHIIKTNTAAHHITLFHVIQHQSTLYHQKEHPSTSHHTLPCRTAPQHTSTFSSYHAKPLFTNSHYNKWSTTHDATQDFPVSNCPSLVLRWILKLWFFTS